MDYGKNASAPWADEGQVYRRMLVEPRPRCLQCSRGLSNQEQARLSRLRLTPQV
nr:hypothetical protein [Paenibacillus xylanexedens]